MCESDSRVRGEVDALGSALARQSAAGERLSGLSSCIGEGDTRVACFSVEANEKLAGQRDADDHFLLPGGKQSVAEAAEVLVVACGNGCDQEHDGTDAGPPTADRPLASSRATVIGDWSDADELGNGLVGIGADLRQLSHQPGDGAIGNSLDGAEGLREMCPQGIVV